MRATPPTAPRDRGGERRGAPPPRGGRGAGPPTPPSPPRGGAPPPPPRRPGGRGGAGGGPPPRGAGRAGRPHYRLRPGRAGATYAHLCAEFVTRAVLWACNSTLRT